MIRTRVRFITAGLLIASAAVFALGTSLERHTEAGEHAPVSTAVGPASQAPPTSPTALTTSPTTPAPTTEDKTTAPPVRPTTKARDSDGDSDEGGDSDSDGGSDEGHDTTHTHAAAPTPTARPSTATTDADGGADQDTPQTGTVSAPAPGATPPVDSDGGSDEDNDAGNAAAEAAEHSELLFGVNVESTPLVVAAVVVSVLLAVAILTIGTPWLAVLIAVVMLIFAALDGREISHQIAESRSGLVALAAVVALLHLLAAIAAVGAARSARREHSATAPPAT